MNEKILAIFATFIAFVSLLFSIYQAHLNQKALEYSVFSRIFVGSSISDGNYKLEATNLGNGSAVIKWIDVIADGKLASNWDDTFTTLGLDIKPGTYSFRMLYPESILPTGFDQSFVLLESDRDNRGQLLWQFDRRINILICYCSISGECFLEPREIMGQHAQTLSGRKSCKFSETYDTSFFPPPTLGQYPER